MCEGKTNMIDYKGWEVTYNAALRTVEATKTATKLGGLIKKRRGLKVTFDRAVTFDELEREIQEMIDEAEHKI